MANGAQIAMAITAEARHPLWGVTFRNVVAGELTEDDIRAARAIRIDHPSWVGAVAGGNPKALEAVAEVALADFIVMTMMEIDGELD